MKRRARSRPLPCHGPKLRKGFVHTRLLLPDLHIPFEDVAALEAWMDHLGDLKPDGVDIIGDVIDAYQLSRFDKNPLRRDNIQEEVDQAVELLTRIRRTVPKADIRYTEGNHEERLRRTLWGSSRNLGCLRGLDIPTLMGLSDLRIQYYTSRQPYKIGPLWYIHGDVIRKSNWSVSAGGTSAAAAARRIQGNVIMGHTHQTGYASFRSWEHGLCEGWEAGCLCRFDLDYVMGTPQWQQGWAVVHFLGTDCFHVDLIRIIPSPKGRSVIYRDHLLTTLRQTSQWKA